MIVVNMVIVSDNVDRGVEIGQSMARSIHRDHPSERFKLSLHVRRNANKLTDDHFERIDG